MILKVLPVLFLSSEKSLQMHDQDLDHVSDRKFTLTQITCTMEEKVGAKDFALPHHERVSIES